MWSVSSSVIVTLKCPERSRFGPDRPTWRTGGSFGLKQIVSFVSETDATPGYIPTSLDAGTWQIMVGAYKVGAEAIDLEYTLRFVLNKDAG